MVRTRSLWHIFFATKRGAAARRENFVGENIKMLDSLLAQCDSRRTPSGSFSSYNSNRHAQEALCPATNAVSHPARFSRFQSGAARSQAGRCLWQKVRRYRETRQQAATPQCLFLLRAA